MLVEKRNGRLVQWDSSRISDAMIKAGVPAISAAAMSHNLMKLFVITKGVVSVEEISNKIEEMLASRGFFQQAKAFILYRDMRRRRRELPDPIPGELARYIHPAKYARERDGFYETYEQSVERVIQMHERRWPDLSCLREPMLARRVLPSMRSLQFGGPAIQAVNERMFNCSYTHLNDPHKIYDVFYLLLAGCGVGYSVRTRHVFQIEPTVKIGRRVRHHTVEDSIRGWSMALKALILSYFTGEYAEFDYSQIRPEGSPLVTSGGLAPGHLALRNMIEDLRKMIPQGRRLRPFEWHCVICRVADAVLSGGIRRSSLIALFDKDDDEMWNCKTGDWFKTHPYLSNANNSVFYVRGEVPDFKRLIKCALEFGEPGFFIGETLDHGCNPCGEIGFSDLPTSPDFDFCNLTEVCVPRCKDKEEFLDAVETATILGTLQATYMNMNVPCVNATEERLLGVSLTGICDTDLPYDWMLDGQARARAVNLLWSQRLGIPQARSITTIKPSGTASLLLECSSGIHPPHAEYYFRRVTANPNEPCAKAFKEANPLAVEVKANGDWALLFPTKGRRMKMSGVAHLELIKKVYKNWVYHPGVCHNVSATVTLDDPERIEEWLYENHESIRAISFISPVGDKTYPHAPREAITTEADMARWREIVGAWRTVDYGAVPYGATDHQEPACGGGACLV